MDIVEQVREMVVGGAVTRAALARTAGLHVNSLRHLERDDWNPTSETLRKLEAALLQGRRGAALATPEAIIDEARNGRMFILVDDEDRENEGDLVIPAQMATPDAINFMARHGRGLICLALGAERVKQLGLPLMARHNGTRHATAFTVSIEARDGVTTGISAADRARTISVAIDAAKGSEHIVSPGHVFPLVARDGGVLVRAGHTEAAVDVARLAGLNPSGVICEIMRDDGTMARLDDLRGFAAEHGLKVGTIRDLIAYRMRHDHLVKRLAGVDFESVHGGRWTAITYANTAEYAEHIVLQKGRVEPGKPTLVRVHVQSMFSDLFGEAGGRAGLIGRAMDAIAAEGAGVLVVIRDARPDAISQQMVAKGQGEPFQLRDYGVGAQILVDLGVSEMRLLTGSHKSYVGLAGYGLTVVGERALPGGVTMPHLLIVEARFYDAIADALLDGARAALEAAGATHETVTVPGALEIPAVIAMAGESGRYDGFVALGCVIRGDTYHFEIVAGESARGIMALTLDGLAVGNGVLTVEDEAQAWARARRTEKDKGGEAAKAALALLALRARFDAG